MKKLLLLGGSIYLIPVIKRAKAMGHYVITCDYLPNNIAHQYSDEYCNVSIIEKEAVLTVAQQLQIDGVMSFATDPGVLTAAYVAHKMGLPSPGPYNSVKILQDKGLFRGFLQEHGFNCPKSKSYSSLSMALEEFEEKDLPVIVKPVDSAGSKGVTKVSQKEELQQAIDYALSYSLSKTFIIEEFLELAGNQASGEAFSIEGDFKFISLSDQRFDKHSPNPYTPAGNSWPNTLPTKVLQYLEHELQRLIGLLEMKTSIYNIEVRLAQNNKAYIMEVSPRGGGNRLAEVIAYATGVDLISNNIKAALGEPISAIKPPQYKGYWGLLNLYSNKAGVFKELEIGEAIKKNIVETELRINPGDKVESFTGAQNAIGTIILFCSKRNILSQILNDSSDFIKVIVE